MSEPKPAQECGQGDYRNQECAAEVGRDHDWLARETIDPGARDESKAKPGSSSATRSTLMADGDASSRRIAVKGSAVRVTSDPKVETVAAPHRLTKLALRRRAPRCMNDARPMQTNRRG